MWFIPKYILILGITICIDYFSGIWIERSESNKKIFLVLSVISTALILFYFKYYNFFIESIASGLVALGFQAHFQTLNIILPVGLSFHTFQSLSYVIEVYRGNQKAEKDFSVFALYVMFYPQLVAGPIERPQNLLHQFHERKIWSTSGFVLGLRFMIWGLFKKVVIADRLAIFANQVFDHQNQFGVFGHIIGVIFFSFQIYCDFSGYSDIALGAALCLGFKLMKNFNKPYISQSVSEFWRRWHVSLSTWFKDYIYIAMGGGRVSILRQYFNLIFTFSISGLWHGANWTFLIWGVVNGLFLVIEDLLRRMLNVDFRQRKNGVLGYFKTSIVFMAIGFTWIFFRSQTFGAAIDYINGFSVGFNKDGFSNDMQCFLNQRIDFYLSFLLIIFLSFIEFFRIDLDPVEIFEKTWFPIQIIIFNSFLLFSIYLGVFGAHKFIYFQF